MNKRFNKLLKKIKKYSIENKIDALKQYTEEYPEDYDLVKEYVDNILSVFTAYAEKRRKTIETTNELLNRDEYNARL
ncbi:MAG: hypothetical protein IKC49_01240 [Clostridia bacterium]|nr:hypothetical protein [Clostridia bacterium]